MSKHENPKASRTIYRESSITLDGTGDDRDKQCNDKDAEKRKKKPDGGAVSLFSSDKDADRRGEDVLLWSRTNSVNGYEK